MVKSVQALEALIGSVDATFKSPLDQTKLASWGLYAHKQKEMLQMMRERCK